MPASPAMSATRVPAASSRASSARRPTSGDAVSGSAAAGSGRCAAAADTAPARTPAASRRVSNDGASCSSPCSRSASRRYAASAPGRSPATARRRTSSRPTASLRSSSASWRRVSSSARSRSPASSARCAAAPSAAASSSQHASRSRWTQSSSSPCSSGAAWSSIARAGSPSASAARKARASTQTSCSPSVERVATRWRSPTQRRTVSSALRSEPRALSGRTSRQSAAATSPRACVPGCSASQASSSRPGRRAGTVTLFPASSRASSPNSRTASTAGVIDERAPFARQMPERSRCGHGAETRPWHNGPMRALLVLAVLALLPTAVARAESTPAADFELGLGSREPAASTGVTLRITFKNPDDPNAAPSPQRKVTIELPRGTRIDGTKVPVYTAPDPQLQAQGAEACPAASRVGKGTVTLRTDGGPAFDPFVDDVDIFNGGKELIELFTHQRSGLRTAVGHRPITSPDTLSESAPPQPGAPPDFESSVTNLNFDLAQSPFTTTPPACPADGLWRSRLTFDTADGHTYTAASTTPCDVTPAAAKPECRSRRTVAIRLPRGARRVAVLLDGRRRATLERPGARAPVSLRGLPRGTHTVTLVVRRAGGSVRITRRYRTCT